MLAAAFETSTRRPSVALRAGDATFEAELSGTRPHASDLLPALDLLLARAGARARDLELLVVGTGPGSFTGLRVAVATAQGLARGGRAELFGLPSGEALCWRELAVGESALVVLDARQGEWYFAHYRRTDGGVQVVHAPCVLPLAQWLPLAPPAVRIFGEPALLQLADLPEEFRARVEAGRVPAASAALELGLVRRRAEGAHAPGAVEPLYLRAFGAKSSKRASD